MLYLAEAGLSAARIGLILSLTLVGDTAISLWITTSADRAGRRRMLVIGSCLVAMAGAVFARTMDFWLLLTAATIGVISPSGGEVGPFLPIEQAALSQLVPAEDRTRVFAWYNLTGALATATGSLVGGAMVDLLRMAGSSRLESLRAVIHLYTILGLVLAGLFLFLTPAIEVEHVSKPSSGARNRIGLHQSRRMVFKLSSLFALDAFGGGFIVQSIAAYWFHVRFGVSASTIGAVYFGANLLAALSALAVVPIARRFGLLQTMVFTHIPSNVLLILVPLMPTLPLAVGVLLLRFSISQMDVPTRQAYTVAVVHPDERSAASGITGVARTAGAAISPSISSVLVATPALMGAPFVLAGALKLAYDITLWISFKATRPARDA